MFVSAVLALAAATVASAAPPAVLSQVPADAKFVIVVNNLKDLNTKIGKAAAQLNLPTPPDLLGYLTRKAQIDKGFDTNNSAAAVMLPIDGNDGKPALVVLLPSTDPKALLSQFQPTGPDKSGIMEVTPPDGGDEKSYATVVGSWVAISPGRATLESYMRRKSSLDKSLPAESLKTFESNDLVVWFNMPALQKDADMALESAQQFLQMGMAQAADHAGTNPSIPALQKAMFNEYFLGLKEYCRDATAGMITLRLTDAGPTLGIIGMFKPESPFGKFFTAQKSASPASLRGLPDGDVLIAGAASWDAASVSELISAMAKRVLSDPTISQDPKIEDYRKIAAQEVAITASLSGMSIVLVRSPSGANGGFFNGAALVHASDPAKYLAEVKQSFRAFAKAGFLMNSDIQVKMDMTENAQTVKGIKFDKIHLGWTLRNATADKPLNPDSQRALDTITRVYGAHGISYWLGTVDSSLLWAFGSDPAILDSAAAATRAKSDPLAKNSLIAASKDHVIPGAIAVAYFPAARWISIVESMVPRGVAPVAPAANVGPIVMSAATSGSTLTIETHAPLGTIRAIKDAVMQYYMHIMGGGGPAAARPAIQ
jgi:hypothetical protein